MTKGQTYPRRGLHGAVVHEIGIRILRGELKPGDLLPTEEQLADGGNLTVSRTVLRETIKVLAAKGLVESRPKTGTRVRPRTAWNLIDPDVLAWRLETKPDRQFFQDLIEIRRILEPEIARLAATRATDEEVDALEAAFREMEAAWPAVDAYLEPDLRFHAIMLAACHNELLEQMATILRGVWRPLFTTASTPPVMERALPLHGAIVDAIRARDADASELAMLVLIDDTAGAIEMNVSNGTPQN